MVETTVQILEVARYFNREQTDKAATLSRPDVGESKNKSLGWVRSSMAMHRRLRSPPEIPLIKGVPTRVSRV